MVLIPLNSLLSSPRHPLLPHSTYLISHSVLYKRHLRQLNNSIRVLSAVLNDCNGKKRPRPIDKIKDENVLRERNNTLRGIRNSLKDRSLLMNGKDSLMEEKENIHENTADLNDQFNDQPFDDFVGTCPGPNDLNYGDDNLDNILGNDRTHDNLNLDTLKEVDTTGLSIVLRCPSKPRSKKSQNLHILSELRQKLKQTIGKYENIEMGRGVQEYDHSFVDNMGDNTDFNVNTSGLLGHMDNTIFNDPNGSGIPENLDNLNIGLDDSLNVFDFINSTHSSFSFHLLPVFPMSFNQHVKNLTKPEKISWFLSLLIQLERGTVVAKQTGCYEEIKVDKNGLTTY